VLIGAVAGDAAHATGIGEAARVVAEHPGAEHGPEAGHPHDDQLVMGYAAAPAGHTPVGRGHRVPLERQGDREDQERGQVRNRADDHLRR
jgi:hypothetical protein